MVQPRVSCDHKNQGCFVNQIHLGHTHFKKQKTKKNPKPTGLSSACAFTPDVVHFVYLLGFGDGLQSVQTPQRNHWVQNNLTVVLETMVLLRKFEVLRASAKPKHACLCGRPEVSHLHRVCQWCNGISNKQPAFDHMYHAHRRQVMLVSVPLTSYIPCNMTATHQHAVGSKHADLLVEKPGQPHYAGPGRHGQLQS